MKFTVNRGPNAGHRAETVILRLITLVLGTYALALFAQTAGMISLV